MRKTVKIFVFLIFFFSLLLFGKDYWELLVLFFFSGNFWQKINLIRIYYLNADKFAKISLKIHLITFQFLIVIFAYVFYRLLNRVIVINKVREYDRHKDNIKTNLYLIKNGNSKNFTQLDYLPIYHNFLFWEEKMEKASSRDEKLLVIFKWSKDHKTQAYVKLLKIKIEK